MTLSQPIPIFSYQSPLKCVLYYVGSSSILYRKFKFSAWIWIFSESLVLFLTYGSQGKSSNWLFAKQSMTWTTHLQKDCHPLCAHSFEMMFFLLIVIFPRTCFLNFLSPLFNRYHILWSGWITFRIKIVKPFESVLNFQYCRLKMVLPRLRDNGTLRYDFYFSKFLLRDNYKKVIGRNPKSHSIRYAINYHYTVSLHPFYVNKPRWYYSIDNNITYITQNVYTTYIICNHNRQPTW